MNKIIPFEEEVIFKTNIYEITSISLEQELSIKDNCVIGEFIISGDYKITSASTTVESFEYHLPIEVDIDEKYDVTHSNVDIDDFYYEIINNNILKVNIDIKIDQLKERELMEMDRKIDILEEENINYTEKEIEPVQEVIDDVPSPVNSIFNNFNNDDTYISYNIYIMRDGDTIDSILEKYQVSEEELQKYNDLSNLVIGSKVIVPNK